MKTIYKKLLFLLLLLPFTVLAQTTLSGTVLDNSSKQPLPGVNVVIQGSTTGTQTDFDGKFQLSNVKIGDVVIFSYLGYKNSSINFSGQSNLNVNLEEDANQLQEVVVQVGYGSVRKKDVTGAVELITTKDFNKGAITSVDGLLNGRAAGVIVTGSGTPGNDAVIRIRGGSSLLASNDPLIVVDGLPIDGGLSSINPNDIESFSILKDASSAAIYGNRGSNGVILITTKKGSKKGIQVSLNTFTTYNTLAKQINVYDSNQFRTVVNNIGPDQAALLGTANTNWQNEIFKESYTSDVSASVLGNIGGKVPARLTIGNIDNNGILLTSQFRRTTGSFSLNPSLLDDHLKINVTGNYSYTFRRNADEGAIGAALSSDPTQPVYDPTSVFAGYYELVDGGGVPRGTANPVALLYERRNISNGERFFGNFNLDYKFHFFPDLRFIFNIGIDKTEGTGTDTTNRFARSGYNTADQFDDVNGAVGSFSNSWYDNRNFNRNASLNYTKAVGKLNVDLTVGYDWQTFDYQNYNSGNQRLFGIIPLAEDSQDVYTDPGNKLQAYFARLNLGFNDKYLVTINFRRDGSSKISPINNFDEFYGAAFAWKIKEESFLKDSKVFSDLKLRISYGETGQQNLPNPYAWIKRYNVSNNAYYQLGNQFYNVARPEGYNENLKWETSRKSNIGLDFAFMNNRLRGTFDAYSAKTFDLFSQTVEGALQNLGIFGPRNIGTLESKGLELGLNFDAVRRENFDLSFNYNATYNKLEITSLFSDNLLVGGTGLQVFTQTHKVGLAPFSYWLYEQVYDANGRPIQGVYVDRDGNGVIDSKDRYSPGKPQADVTMGFLTNATFYKNWDFSMAWRASIGNYVYDQVSSDRASLSSIYNTQTQTLNNSPVSYEDTYFTGSGTQVNTKESDYFLKDGSFVKLDNITLGYNFRKIFNSDTNSVRLTLGVQNVLTITKYKGLDPEVFNNGIDASIFPRARMYMLGMNVNF